MVPTILELEDGMLGTPAAIKVMTMLASEFLVLLVTLAGPSLSLMTLAKEAVSLDFSIDFSASSLDYPASFIGSSVLMSSY